MENLIKEVTLEDNRKARRILLEKRTQTKLQNCEITAETRQEDRDLSEKSVVEYYGLGPE